MAAAVSMTIKALWDVRHLPKHMVSCYYCYGRGEKQYSHAHQALGGFSCAVSTTWFYLNSLNLFQDKQHSTS